MLDFKRIRVDITGGYVCTHRVSPQQENNNKRYRSFVHPLLNAALTAEHWTVASCACERPERSAVKRP